MTGIKLDKLGFVMTKTIVEQRAEVSDELISRLHEFDSLMAAARSASEEFPKLFANRESARNSLRSARARALKSARKGVGTDATIPEGFSLKGTTTLFKGGEQVLQWVKTDADKLKQASIISESLEALAEDLPKVKATPAPNQSAISDSLCNLYTITDAHLGMMASAGESGEQYDLTKAEALFSQGFKELIQSAPKARRCVISQLGDFLHSDGLDAVTPRSKHPLDQSHRFHDLVRSATRLLRGMIDAALEVHEYVELVIAEGNHDLASSVWLRIAFENIYENEPRLRVIQSDLPFYATTHGDTMLGFHHGHIQNIKAKASANELALTFANGEEWKGTVKHYIHVGHHHTESMIEVRGCKLYGHPTFAAPDAHATREFGGSMRGMTSHTYHKRHGLVGTNTITPEMLD